MSWGPATVFIHRRLNHDGSPFGPPDCLALLPSDSVEYQEPRDGSSSEEEEEDDEEEDEEEEEEEEEGEEEEENSEDDDDSEDSDVDSTDSDEDDDSSSDSSNDGDVSPFGGGMDEFYSRNAQSITDQYSQLSQSKARSSGSGSFLVDDYSGDGQYKPSARPGKLSIQPTTDTYTDTDQYKDQYTDSNAGRSQFGAGSPLRPEVDLNGGFNSPQDSALLLRKALASKRF